jgi:hypothetical protein
MDKLFPLHDPTPAHSFSDVNAAISLPDESGCPLTVGLLVVGTMRLALFPVF